MSTVVLVDKNIYSYDDFMKNTSFEMLHLSLVGLDSYTESKILIKINDAGFNECLAIAIQLAIIGYGKKSFGKVVLDDKEIDIQKFFKEKNILYNTKENDKLKNDDLTPRRLIRFFRYHVQKYIIDNNCESYLYKKYCYEKKQELKKWIFPGVEHIFSDDIQNKNEIIIALFKTYNCLDRKYDINVTEKIKRVLIAQGIDITIFEEQI